MWQGQTLSGIESDPLILIPDTWLIGFCRRGMLKVKLCSPLLRLTGAIRSSINPMRTLCWAQSILACLMAQFAGKSIPFSWILIFLFSLSLAITKVSHSLTSFRSDLSSEHSESVDQESATATQYFPHKVPSWLTWLPHSPASAFTTTDFQFWERLDKIFPFKTSW